MSVTKDEGMFREISRKNGWRFTRQRFAVYSFICGNRTHPGVDEVWAHVRRTMPRVTRESVFRILGDFVAAGLIVRLDRLPAARFDACTTSHGHFICTKCGRIVDFDLPEGFRVEVPADCAPSGFVDVRVSGLCARCRRSQ